MAHLRFGRDRQGYETTALVHSCRERGRERVRLLYWFRSPPHIRVGRAPLDEAAIREIEAQNPDIEFDWTVILQARPPAPVPEDQRMDRRRAGRQHDPRNGRRDARGPQSQAARTDRVRSGTVALSWAVAQAEGAALRAEAAPAPSELPSLELELPEALSARIEQGSPDAPASAAERRLGPDLLNRLRGRCAALLARITERVADPAAADALRARVAALDPDAWVTDAEVERGLTCFEEQAAALRAALGDDRRRTRRGGRRHRRQREAAAGAAGEDAPGAIPAAPANPDEPAAGEA